MMPYCETCRHNILQLILPGIPDLKPDIVGCTKHKQAKWEHMRDKQLVCMQWEIEKCEEPALTVPSST